MQSAPEMSMHPMGLSGANDVWRLKKPVIFVPDHHQLSALAGLCGSCKAETARMALGPRPSKGRLLEEIPSSNGTLRYLRWARH